MDMTTPINRHPAGTSEGGRFATGRRDEQQAASLVDDPAAERERKVDRAAKLRGHAFMPPKSVLKAIPKLYGTENQKTSDVTAHIHYFAGRCNWYITEYDPETGEAFGVADLGHGPELGYISLPEMESTIAETSQGLPIVIERDCYWSKQRLGEIPSIADKYGDD